MLADNGRILRDYNKLVRKENLMKRKLFFVLVLMVLIPTTVLSGEIRVYDDNDQFLGILVDHLSDSSMGNAPIHMRHGSMVATRTVWVSR